MVCHPVAAITDVKEGIFLCLWHQCRSVVLCIHEEAQRDGLLSESAHSCRSAAGFVISETKRCVFSLLDLGTTGNYSSNIIYKRMIGANLCLSPGSTGRYPSCWLAVHFRGGLSLLGWLYCRTNLSWLFHTWLFL